ncbi:DNA polymerase III subunit gamma/tau [Sinimarinibacterium sp. CAU 1509]|uniref:DNA polymerase III subunit gamma/tau n=1 Tax=Sinimarinibacterium sp. CAU 1509 TaxID=2562283 RepID=UPI0010ACA394|nr:DNA polymerase III subunit gamma/tau [Sinimarinibacterium sp. CAU 1509]TJY62145.1 DNA polymerase III subunit gamma/tau [Sinimarinibacterium sp. CAU 1509]
MSYLALARKYRPRQFPDVMGQDHVVKALSHALDGDKLHPAILLTGTRGVGKTTLARIIAKCLNCETGVSAHPCGVCSACTEVDSGRFVDLLEIDAASNTGVDDVRQLIDNAQYSPARGRYKVYLIDEVHMLSKSAFNALLKTLEEPPPHVKFILATTDPQKLLVTVLSRCLQFNLKRLPVAVIRDQLIKVLGDENIDFETAAVVEIARSADGSMRDGLSLLDQAIAFAGGKTLQRETVEDMLGSGGRQTLIEIIAALASRNGDQLLACLQKLEAQSPDYAALINDLSAAMQRIAVLQMLPGARTEDDDEALVALTSQFTPEDVQLGYQIAIGGRRDMPWAPDPRLGFEMTVLRMLAFQPEEAGSTGSMPPTGGGQARSSEPSSRSAAGGVSAAAPSTAAAAAAAGQRPAPSADMMPKLPPDASWPQRVEAMRIEGFTRQLARHCAWVSQVGNVVQLELDPQVRHVLQEDRRVELEAQLRLQLGDNIQLRINTAQEQVELASPAVLAKQAEIARQRAAEESIQADPVVRAFRDHFGAQIRPGSIHPLDS